MIAGAFDSTCSMCCFLDPNQIIAVKYLESGRSTCHYVFRQKSHVLLVQS